MAARSTISDTGVYYTSVRDPTCDCNQIRYLEFKTGRTKPLLAVKQWTAGLSVTPDDRDLLFGGIGEGGTDLVLVENFR